MESLLSNKQFIYIIGAQRSGTTWLHTMLGEHPNVGTAKVDGEVAELTMFNHYVAPLMKAWETELIPMKQGKWNRGLPCIWSEEEFISFLRRFLNEAYVKIGYNETVTHIVDKDPFYSQHVHLIHRLIPNARFIHIIRDGRNVAVSLASAKNRVGIGTANISHAAWEWQHHINLAREAAEFGEDRYLEIRYEDLFAATDEVLQRVFQFCHLDASFDTVRSIANDHQCEIKMVASPNPDVSLTERRKNQVFQTRLTVMEKFVIEKRAGELLRDLDYVTDHNWWYDNISDKLATFVKHLLYRVLRRSKSSLIFLFKGHF